MKTPRKTMVLLAAAFLLLPALAWAKPDVKISIVAEKDIQVEENGEKVTRRVAAEEVEPGEIVIYTITFVNSGDEAASNVSIVDPIPQGMAYIAGSATRAGELTFSIDGGKSYQAPTLLTYEVTTADGKKERRTASPDQYTHLRWLVPTIAVNETGTLSFQVKTQ